MNNSIDPGETTDIFTQFSEVLNELRAAWDEYAKELAVILVED